jgi:AmmeMemoRadiSam system protein B/AmmeMemoRadiSam system protein A
MGFIRQPAVAGSFYPADPHQLAADLRRMLAEASGPRLPAPKALIAPHAGYVYSGPIAATAYSRLREAHRDISRVVLIGPAHRVAFSGIGVSTAEAFRTPLGDVPLDAAGITRALSRPGVVSLDEAHRQEHSLEVHLPFLQMLLDRFTLVPLVAGDAPDEMVADVLESLWGGPETLVVVSSDLSHYQDYEAASRQDRATAEAIARLDASFDHYSACGRTPLGGLLMLAKKRGMKIETLDVRNSGDTAGPRDRVVGYGAWALYEPGPEKSLPEILLGLARQAIERRLSDRTTPLSIPPLPELQEKGASFVTLHKDGHLRGCIGSPIAWRPLGEDVADNAVRAAFSDPRFPPMGADEMFRVKLSLSLLTPPEPMRFGSEEDLLAQLRPRIDGLIIEDQGRHALFLPAVWEQLPDPADFLAHLKHKAGLAPDHWSAEFRASRFTANEYHEA